MDLMIDLETGDIEVSAAILSVGACMFDPYSLETGAGFILAIPPGDNDAPPRRTWSGSTIQFWSQNPTALAELGKQPQGNLVALMNQLATFIAENKPDCIWAMSPTFDITKLRHLYASHNRYFPIPFHKERDVRTLKAILPPSLHPIREGTHHNALDDCLYQALLVQTYFAHCFIRD